MPKSKRDKKISLTNTKRKGLEWKQHIIEDIRSCVDQYKNIFVFSVDNMRNGLLKELRTEWKHSRFFFGKNRIMQLGLGKTEAEEADRDLAKLSTKVQGQCGLLFTSKSKEFVVKTFENYSAVEYARSGFVATETIVLPEGQLPEFTHAIEPHLRALGLPTKLDKGIVALYKEHTVCEEGKVLTPEQAKILKLIEKPMATFSLTLKCCWSKKRGFEPFEKVEKIEKSEKSSKKKKASKVKKVVEDVDDEVMDAE